MVKKNKDNPPEMGLVAMILLFFGTLQLVPAIAITFLTKGISDAKVIYILSMPYIIFGILSILLGLTILGLIFLGE